MASLPHFIIFLIIQKVSTNANSLPLIDTLPNSAFNASSYWDNTFFPHFSKFSSSTAWAAKTKNVGEWLLIDLQIEYVITEISTMGSGATGPNSNEYVQTYTLNYAANNEPTFTVYPVTFDGNDDTNTAVNHTLIPPFIARYLRFHPLTVATWPSMRVEAYGYIGTLPPTYNPTQPSSSPTTSPTIPTTEPSKGPTKLPTAAPTKNPTKSPTKSPTNIPTTSEPTITPTNDPTIDPTFDPTTIPTNIPTKNPTTLMPTLLPTYEPTNIPTFVPSVASTNPTDSPIATFDPTNDPSVSPTQYPSVSPTPSDSPTNDPTNEPTVATIGSDTYDTGSDDMDMTIIVVLISAFLFCGFCIVICGLFWLYKKKKEKEISKAFQTKSTYTSQIVSASPSQDLELEQRQLQPMGQITQLMDTGTEIHVGIYEGNGFVETNKDQRNTYDDDMNISTSMNNIVAAFGDTDPDRDRGDTVIYDNDDEKEEELNDSDDDVLFGVVTPQ